MLKALQNPDEDDDDDEREDGDEDDEEDDKKKKGKKTEEDDEDKVNSEWTDMYATMAKEAKEEGFDRIAYLFEAVGKNVSSR